MCGIVGFITLDNKTKPFVKDKFFAEALYMSALRGMHSTGIMGVSEDFKWSWAKNAMPAARFLSSASFKEREKNSWCMMGHTRHATVGDITTDNAHPFHHENIILMHNGTLRSLHTVPHREFKFKVDSEQIAHSLNKVAPEEAGTLLGKLEGAYALVWFDLRDKSINIVRNPERPLHLALGPQNDILYLMSEGHMLNSIFHRFQTSQQKPANIWQLGTYQLLKYIKGDLTPEVTEITPKPATSHYGNTGGYTWPNRDTVAQRRRESASILNREGYLAGRIVINGERRNIPDGHKVMLEEWYQLDVKENYLFEPESFETWNIKDYSEGMTRGLLWHPEWKTWMESVMYCTRRSMLNQFKDQSWTVCPIGVSHVSKSEDSNDPVIIVRPQWYSWNGDLPPKDMYEYNEEEEEEEEEKKGTLLRGPHGDITVEAWKLLCADGCNMCSVPLFPATDAEDLTWGGEMNNQPLCFGCVEEYTEANS
jgi:hypothetical protein